MNKSPLDRYENLLTFTLSEKFITLTVIGSIFTFAFISSMKGDLIDPFIDFIMPDENFDFMNITMRDGIEIPVPYPKKIKLNVGNFFKAFITWIFAISILFVLAKFSRFPDSRGGNVHGAAIM